MADSDPVNRPAHYTFSAIEVIDAIEAWGLGFHLGNAIKYVARAGRKGDALQDLLKARWYLDRAIERDRKVVEQTQGDLPELPSFGACPEEGDKPECYLHVFKDNEQAPEIYVGVAPHEHDWSYQERADCNISSCVCGAEIEISEGSSTYSREDGSKHSTWHQASKHRP